MSRRLSNSTLACRLTVYEKGGDNMTGYAGKIGNAGSQKVEAPFKATKSAKGKVQKGDLRDK